jgi:Putative NADPH-quinone reductase (modulator of drug activity B)
MKKIFIINGGQRFAQSSGEFNKILTDASIDYFKNKEGYEVKVTDINDPYVPKEEVEKFVWADIVIYHTPIWWFQVPHEFKKYLDFVFIEGQNKGLYKNDGRTRKNPTRNYGTGGQLQGKKYILTTSWNAPLEAFTLEGEFFDQKSVDEGVMFGFHKMNAYTGMKLLSTFHFYDMDKNADHPSCLKLYNEFLDGIFNAES